MLHKLLATIAILFVMCPLSILRAQQQINLPVNITSNRIESVERDGSGFYWFICNDGQVARWSGKKFFTQHSFQDKFSLPEVFKIKRSINQDIYAISSNGTPTRLIDSLGNLSENKKNANIIFTETEEVSQLKEIAKNNPPSLLSQFYKSIRNKKIVLNTSTTTSYIIGDDAVYYCNAGKLYYFNAKFNFQKTVHGIINNCLLLIEEGNYTILFNNGSLDKGFAPSLKGISSTISKKNLNTHNQGSLQLWADQKIINIQLHQNKLVVNSLLEINKQNTYSAFFYDESDRKVVLITQTDKMEVYKIHSLNSVTNSTGQINQHYYPLIPINNKIFDTKLKNHFTKYQEQNLLDEAMVPLNETSWFYSTGNKVLYFSGQSADPKASFSTTSPVSSAAIVKGSIFISCGTLCLLDTIQKKIQPAIIENLSAPNSIRYIVPESPESLLGLNGNTLCRITIAANGYYYKPITQLADPISLTYDNESRLLLITTKKDGIYCYNVKTNSLNKLPYEGGEAIQYSRYIVKDNFNDFWIITKRGLYLLYHKNLEVFLLNPEAKKIQYSLVESDTRFITDPIVVQGKIKGDSLFLLSDKGIFSLSVTNTKRKELITASAIRMNNIKVDDSVHASLPVHLPGDFTKFSVELDYSAMKFPDAHLEFRIVGQKDTGWIMLPEDGIINLQNLSAGNFKLQLRSNFQNPTHILEHKFSVGNILGSSNFLSLVWMTAFVSLIFLGNNLYLSRLRNKALIDIDTSRKQLFTVIAHDLRSPINSYQHLGETFNFFVKKGDFEKVNLISQHIEKSGNNLNLLLDNLLNWSLIAQKRFRARKEPITLETLTTELIPLYQLAADINKVSINFHSNSVTVVNSDKLLVSLIIRNLLDNATKNAKPESNINIDISAEGNYTLFSLSNTIYEDDKEKLMELISFLKNKSIWNPESSGLGIGLIKKATKEIDAKLRVELNNNIAFWKLYFPAN